MTRSYTMKRRAEQQAQTRQRIIEAAVDLHGSVGPAATTLSMIAERAGVQRHTLYAHFPDERGLFLACSGHAMARDPLPDPENWQAEPDRRSRLRRGLAELYGWYARNEPLLACVVRDAEHHALTREVHEMHVGPFMGRCVDVLGATLTPRQLALLALALSFHSWRTLTRDGGLDQADAAAEMAAMIEAAA